MSLYGQVKRVPTNVFQFDRVYPNRKAMEDAAKTDGVYIGRYVLIEYGTRYKLFGSAEPRENETNYYNLDDPTQVPTNNSQESNSGESQENDNDSQESDNNTNNDSQESDEVITDSNGNRIEETIKYKTNRETDQNYYHAVYDSTVWQKIYAGTQGEKYVMIAELNALAPQITSEIIDPLKYSKSTEASADSDNIYYIVRDTTEGSDHLPIAAVPISNIKETMTNPSLDMQRSNELAYTLNMPASVKFSVDDTLNYNKEGFDYVYSMPPDSNDKYNFICWSPVGIESNLKVNNPEPGSVLNNVPGSELPTVEYNSDNTISASEKRLYFNVPAFGNLMSELYDLVYGKPKNEAPYVRPYFAEAHEEEQAAKRQTEGDDYNLTYENDVEPRTWLKKVPTIGDLLASNSEGLAGILSHLISNRDPLSGQIRFYLQTSWNEYFDPDRNSPFIDNKPEVVGTIHIKDNGMVDASACDYVIDYNSWSMITPIKTMLSEVNIWMPTTLDETEFASLLNNQRKASISYNNNAIVISGTNFIQYAKDVNEAQHKYVIFEINTGLDTIVGLKLDDYIFTYQDEINFNNQNISTGHILYYLPLDTMPNVENSETEKELTIILSKNGYMDKSITFKFNQTT